MTLTAKTYARVADGVVAELLTTTANPAELFHPALKWVDVTGKGVAEGWHQQGAGFQPPPPPAHAPAATLAELQAQFAALAAKLAALSAS